MVTVCQSVLIAKAYTKIKDLYSKVLGQMCYNLHVSDKLGGSAALPIKVELTGHELVGK